MILLAAALLLVPQQPTGGEIALRQALLDATTDAVVMNVAAHPDDESARTMVLLRNRYGVRTVTVYSTCGEGGQNAISPEIGPKLAAIRARETLAAASRYGTEVRWLGFPDFGFSKSLPETLAVWGADETLARMRAALDAVDPDLVLTNHTFDGGHGHHRASAWAIERVCLDRSLATGRLVPLYQRAGRQRTPSGDTPSGDTAAGEPGTTAPPQPELPVAPVFDLDPGEFDPVRGATFARQAHEAWTLHRSQGPWGEHDPIRVGADRWQQAFPEVRPGATGSDGLLAAPVERFGSVFDDPEFRARLAASGADPAAVASAFAAMGEERTRDVHVAEARRLLGLLRALDVTALAPTSIRRLDRRVDALEQIVAYGSGVSLVTWLPATELAFGRTLPLRLAVLGPGVTAVRIRCGDQLAEAPTGRGDDQAAANPESADAAAADAPAARRDNDWWRLALSLPDAAATDPIVELTKVYRFEVEAEFECDGLLLHLRRELVVDIARRSDVTWSRDRAYVPATGGWRRVVSLGATWNGDQAMSEEVRLRGPGDVSLTSMPAKVELSPQRREARVLVRIERPADAPERTDVIRLGAAVGDAGRADLELTPVPVPPLGDRRIAIVRGPDDTTDRFLTDLGVPFTTLDETAFAVAELGDYSTLLLDIRAYFHRPDLAAHRERMLEFCRSGGRVVVMYHKTGEWNANDRRPLLAPFPLEIGGGRVSEEDAEVTFLAPDHRLLNQPFQIGRDDFAGWVQERCLYVAGKRDPVWQPLLSMHDAGEKPLDGVLLYAACGEGDYIYCSLSLYRQLREGHLGAARLMLNLLLP